MTPNEVDPPQPTAPTSVRAFIVGFLIGSEPGFIISVFAFTWGNGNLDTPWWVYCAFLPLLLPVVGLGLLILPDRKTRVWFVAGCLLACGVAGFLLSLIPTQPPDSGSWS